MTTDYNEFQPTDVEEEHDWRKGVYNNLHTFSASSSKRSKRILLGVFITLTILLQLILIIVMASNSSALHKKMKETEEAFSNFTLSIHAELQLIQSKDIKHQEELQKLEDRIKQSESYIVNFNKLFSEKSSGVGQSFSDLQCDLAKRKSNGTMTACCPDGWERYSKSCYFISKSTMSWHSANQFCISKSSNLTSINTPGEQDFLASKTVPFFTWIGLTDASGQWMWLDGSDYSSGPKYWIPGQPDDYYLHEFGGGEDCAHLHDDGRWNDEQCSRLYRWVCEKDGNF